MSFTSRPILARSAFWERSWAAFSRACAVFLLLSATIACTLDEGEPWGRAELSLAAYAPVEGAGGDSNAILTPYDYRIDISRLDIEFEAIELVISGESSGPQRFDPANPPAGYSLCHNGHCHAADGSLVDYADIERELGGSNVAARTILQAIEGSTTLIPAANAPVPLGECVDDCALPRGAVQEVRVIVHGLRLEARVEDLREGDARRLDSPLVIAQDVELEQTYSLPVDERFGRGENLRWQLALEFTIAPSFWERIRWDEIAAAAELSTALEAAIRERLMEHVDLRSRSARP